MITEKNKLTRIICLLILVILLITLGCSDTDWRTEFKENLSLFGHRNWIIVADAAYPLQSAPGIKTIATGEDHLHVLRAVLQEIEKAPHVKPIILLDAELAMLSEEEVPGIDGYQTALKKILNGQDTKALPHETIIAKLDNTAHLFNVLILKTNMVLPYTTVFLELDCAYWNAEKEQQLRGKLDKNQQ
jgi:hypothetical protein